MRFSTDGLVINEQKVGERDRLVTLLTRDFGIIRAFVRGTNSLKNPKNSATRLLCYSDFNIYQRKDAYIIDNAEAKEMFIKLRTDIIKTSLAQYFCELAYMLSPRESNSETFLTNILNSLYVLSAGLRSNLQVKSVLELRLISLAGFMPNLVCCNKCKKFEDEQMAFNYNNGNLLCMDCFNKLQKKNIHDYSVLNLSVVSAMRHTIYSDRKKIFSFTLSEKSLYDFSSVTERYVFEKTEKILPTLEFYKKISS